VSGLPLFGTKMVIDLGRRESIAGLRYGIPGMRVGGTREIVISPHLAYRAAGIPGRIPANALLRCEVRAP
jgi:FKBP-type peptidyl-prolyl cis-trans isomerase